MVINIFFKILIVCLSELGYDSYFRSSFKGNIEVSQIGCVWDSHCLDLRGVLLGSFILDKFVDSGVEVWVVVHFVQGLFV